jgi:cell division initiation protein
MKVTPLDLRQAKLRVVMRGYDRTEVDALLNEVADDYEQALREADRLHQELLRLEAVVAEHREHERNLRNTLLTAQRLSDEIREHAEQESRRVLEEAESRAELVFQQTQNRLEDVQREIDGLKLKRRDVETTLQSTIATLRNALEFVREQDQKEREDKILLHRPRQSAPEPPMAVLPQMPMAKAVNESPTAAVMRALDAAAEGQK